jgi:hypothetical protein
MALGDGSRRALPSMLPSVGQDGCEGLMDGRHPWETMQFLPMKRSVARA